MARYFDCTTPPHITTLVLMAGVAVATINIFLFSALYTINVEKQMRR